MNIEPIIFEIKIDDFDYEILPIPIEVDLLKENPELREKAVYLYYEDFFKNLGGEVDIKSDGEYIKVFWSPSVSNEVDAAVEQAIMLLQKGAYTHAEPILRTLFEHYPEHPDVLFNYGMMLSDKGRMKEAIEYLSRLTAIDPKHANAWNALGIAYLRNGQSDDAKTSLKQSYDLDPENGYTLRNLGGLLAKENPKEAFPFLKNCYSMTNRHNMGMPFAWFRLGNRKRLTGFLKRQ